MQMSPRRSPRLKETGKYRVEGPELPRKPRRPKRVNNAAEDSVRQANFQAELAAWQVAQQEHADLMKIRKREKTAAWKLEGRAKSCPAPGRASGRASGRSCPAFAAQNRVPRVRGGARPVLR